MQYYPLFVSLAHMNCLVVGAGTVGLRKIEGLLQAKAAALLVLDIKACPPALAERMQSYPKLRYEQRSFVPEDLDGMNLVFAASGARAVNAGISALCLQKGIWCNCIDAPEEGSFIVPAHVQTGDIALALSTGGNSPALSRKIRIELESILKTRYVPLARLLGRVRPLVLALNMDTGQNTAIFRQILVMADALQTAQDTGNDQPCADLLKACLPPTLHQHIAELLHGLA